MAGTLILPKVRKSDGMIVATSIDTDMIKGCEPKSLTINGKQYPGTKVYTDNGNTFYVLAAPMVVTGAKIAASKAQGLIAVDSLKAIPSYQTEILAALSMVDKLALPAKSSAE